MAKATSSNTSWVFIFGVALAIGLGIFQTFEGSLQYTYLNWILVLFGILIGFLNITEKESKPFMIAGTILILIATLSYDAYQLVFSDFQLVPKVLDALVMLFSPAVVITAIREVWKLAEKK